ncbi:MAG: tetratricopeptide repeat protein [Pseudomonadota bacterium]
MSVADFEQWQSDRSNLKALQVWLAFVQEQGLQSEAVAKLQPLALAEMEPSESVPLYTALFSLELDLKHMKQASDWIDKLDKVDPEGFRPEYFRGQLLQAAGQFEAAKQRYLEAGKRNNQHADIWSRLIRCCMMTHDQELALRILTEVQKLDWPMAVERKWVYSQGCSYQQAGQYSLAMLSFARLIQDCLDRGVPKNPQQQPAKFSQVPEGAPLIALKEATAVLEEQGLRPFPTAGTLLGWWRENRFLSHDKDIDIMLPPGDDLELAYKTLSASPKFMGVFNEMGYINFRSFAHRDTEIVIDVGHHEVVANGMVQCAWRVPGIPDDQYRKTLQKSYTLTRDTWLGVEFWRPQDPDAFLSEMYGDWRTPVVGFDTVISGLHLVGFPDVVRCYAYNRLASWFSEGLGDKAVSYLEQIIKKDPLDPIANSIKRFAAKRAASSG